MNSPEPSRSVNRRSFLQRSAVLTGLAAALGPLHALGQRVSRGEVPPTVTGYGPLVEKGDLWLPREFNYQIISRQGTIMSDGAPTPGIFDGMGAFPDAKSDCKYRRTVLIRNHENREVAGELRVITPPTLEYDAFAFGGNTKLVVERNVTGEIDEVTGLPVWQYKVVRDFAILGGTTTNCAGGELPFKRWLTCEEVVKRSPNGRKHGYVFEVDAMSDVPVPALPVTSAGRFAHEAAAWRNGILYLTEDRSLDSDPALGLIGSCFYRYLPDQTLRRNTRLAYGTGRLQALKLKHEFHANMDSGRTVGRSYPVEWVPVSHPDHDDDSDNRRDRVLGYTPTRIQAQDKGAAFFDRLEGAWAIGAGTSARIYFDCTAGGPANLGQIWEYHPAKGVITLVFESTSAATMENPDNITIVPQTKDILVCEDGGGDQFIRGITRGGGIYDFAKTGVNLSEFCGACFDRTGTTLFVNQQGARGDLPGGPLGTTAVTYAIYGPFKKRLR